MEIFSDESRPENWMGTETEIQEQADFDFYKSQIESLPTIEVSDKADRPSRAEGKWIEHKYAEEYDGLMQSNFECSKCRDWLREQTNYCPNCGAKMEG